MDFFRFQHVCRTDKQTRVLILEQLLNADVEIGRFVLRHGEGVCLLYSYSTIGLHIGA